ncbi:MAG: hypothetical protein GY913_01750 [Proteobacteria bacterium]|nr:hypothetical protein [Pseudomonadota bacterium]MCP4915624.1 hypothetical protein [Pseudomonadota bacterium]
MERRKLALAGILLMGVAGCENTTEANAPPAEIHASSELIGTWETDVNAYKWQIDAGDTSLDIHGWDQATGNAFRVKDVEFNGSLLTFSTTGNGEAMDHAFRPSGDGEMTAHCEGEALGELDFELNRIPGTGPKWGSGRQGP